MNNSVIDPSECGFEIRDSRISGRGCFALRRIPEDTRIIEYVGERISKEESLQRCEAGNNCIFTVDEQWDIDGAVDWNPARYINHSCAPNCRAEDDAGRIWIVAETGIEPGQELTFNYGYGIDDYKDYPCQCGSNRCVGFMVAEEYFKKLRRNLALQ